MEGMDERAEKRLQVILDHLSGRLNATQAALELGVSRKTFYDWLERGRTGMLQALKDRPTGRPPEAVDPEKESLQEELQRREREQVVLESRLRIQEAIRETLEESARESSPLKKKRVSGSDSNGG
jgi:transposase